LVYCKTCLKNNNSFDENFDENFDDKFNLNDDSLFVIYSAGNSGYQEWQSDLLDFSFNESKQPGTLVRIVSDDNNQRKIIKTKFGKTLITPDYSKISNDKVWPVMNKPGSMKFFMDSLSTEFKERNKNSTLLFLDPDMIFINQWDPRDKFKSGQVYGQKWKGYGNKYCVETSIYPENCPVSDNNVIMFPFAIKLGDFDSISDDIANFAKNGYLKKNQWMADMSAFVTAIERKGLENIPIDNLGLCNNWDNNNDPDAPIMHYCQAIRNIDGKEIWGKRIYQSDYKHGDIFNKLPDHSQTTNRVDREVIKMLTKFRNKQLY